MERNPDSCCENCPFWFEMPAPELPQGTPAEQVPPRLGQCRESKPQLFMFTQKVPVIERGALTLNARGAPQVSEQERVGFQPMQAQTTFDYVCGDHPDFFIEEDEPEEPLDS